MHGQMYVLNIGMLQCRELLLRLNTRYWAVLQAFSGQVVLPNWLSVYPCQQVPDLSVIRWLVEPCPANYLRLLP